MLPQGAVPPLVLDEELEERLACQGDRRHGVAQRHEPGVERRYVRPLERLKIVARPCRMGLGDRSESRLEVGGGGVSESESEETKDGLTRSRRGDDRAARPAGAVGRGPAPVYLHEDAPLLDHRRHRRPELDVAAYPALVPAHEFRDIDGEGANEVHGLPVHLERVVAVEDHVTEQRLGAGKAALVRGPAEHLALDGVGTHVLPHVDLELADVVEDGPTGQEEARAILDLHPH